jgi:integrase/recombinase XerD
MAGGCSNRSPEGIGGGPLFWHGDGERFQNVFSRFYWLGTLVGRDDPTFRRFRYHDLRHLPAVEWLRSGRSIYDLQKRLGHASITTTEIYLEHLTADEQHRVKNLGATGGTK